MLHIFLLLAYNIFASTSDVLLQPYEENLLSPTQFSKLDVNNPEKTATPPGVTVPEYSPPYISTEGLSIPLIRQAAFQVRNEPISEGKVPAEDWPCFDYMLEQAFLSSNKSHPVGLLQIIFQPSKCSPLNSRAIWEDNQQSISIFQVIEHRLEHEKGSKTRKLLSQLHSVGTLALASFSPTMYSELSSLFNTIYNELKTIDEEITRTAIAMPQKSIFVNAMHRDTLSPWQNIGSVSHYARWLIEYRKSLSSEADAHSTELHKIVTQQINAFLSPAWNTPAPTEASLFPSLTSQIEWNTALWMSDDYVKEFLAFAKTQPCDECKFTQIIEAYEKSAIELINARECRFHFSFYKRPIEWIFDPKRKSNSIETDRELDELLSKATPMLTVNIPTGYAQTASCRVLDPHASYAFRSSVELHSSFPVPHGPKASSFIPGSDHLNRATKWHIDFAEEFTKAGGALHADDLADLSDEGYVIAEEDDEGYVIAEEDDEEDIPVKIVDSQCVVS